MHERASPSAYPGQAQGARPKRLLEQVGEKLRAMHYSYRTEQAYLDWIKRFILFHGKRHPREMGAPEIEAFVSHLATGRGVSASTQMQALSAVLYLYKHVLDVDVGWIDGITQAKRPQRARSAFECLTERIDVRWAPYRFAYPRSEFFQDCYARHTVPPMRTSSAGHIA